MSNPTSNFGWQMPTSTDLVTDLPADFEVFGQAVDTSLADLKGGTTGQILSKATNADMDFTWVAPTTGDITGVTAGTGISGGGTSGDVTITNSMATAIDAKGDLIAGTGADAFSRLAVGTNGQILQADSTTATGLKWATASSNPTGWSLLNSGGTALTGAATITVSSISAKQLMILVADASSVNAYADYRITFNSDSGTNYLNFGIYNGWGSTYFAGNYDNIQQIAGNYIPFSQLGDQATGKVSGYCFIDLADQTGWKRMHSASSGDGTSGGVNFQQFTIGGIYKASAAITSVSLYSSGGNFDGGTIYIYGAN